MKRSEMVGLIVDMLEHFERYGLSKLTYDQEAEQILSLIEQVGMLPPIEPGRTVSDLDLGVPEWEEENEV